MAKILAHRGFSGKYPENTMLAFRQAIAAGAEGVEFDVQLTKDGVPVILHDESLLRTGGLDALIRDLTYEEAARLDLAGPYRGQVEPQRLPTLEEYFRLVKDLDFLTNIELKTSIFEYPGIEEKVIDLIRAYGLSDRVILSSFNHYSLLRVKALAPELPCGILYECRIAEPQDYARVHHMDYLHPHELFLTPEELEKYAAAGIRANPWTVNDPNRMEELLSSPAVYAIITNHPDVALALRK